MSDEARERAHWLIERDLRERLLASDRDERERVTAEVYDELFERVPWHPANQPDSESPEDGDHRWLRAYSGLCSPGATVADLGCGLGGVVIGLASRAKEAVGVDSSREMVQRCRAKAPVNTRFVVGSVVDPPLERSSFDLITSRQVIEHLHPEDLDDHLRAVARLLKPDGAFLVVTPQALTGPWDCSRGFTEEPSGFHTAEMTHAELAERMIRAGFRRTSSPVGGAGVRSRLRVPGHRGWVPTRVKSYGEKLVSAVPPSRRGTVAKLTNTGLVTVLGRL
ncbi:MAG: class I SAM-dependent methyltransferase [Thermoleophilia bacterium]|nr:class I SAM-dependent methyltransferase [Thermoleophilia bacterium]MDH3725584.1 class I SAM-dependent methyltransferase [Thermoleophilia bacterium]